MTCTAARYSQGPGSLLVLLFAGLTPFRHFGDAFTPFTMRTFTLWWTFSMKYQSLSCPGALGLRLFCPLNATSMFAFLSSGRTSGIP